LKRISQAKKEILKLLCEIKNPLSLREVSERTGLEARSANMHLFGLLKLGFVSKSESGRYTITGSGREVIGFPKVDEKFAEKVLKRTPPEKAFRFYNGINQPTGISSDNLVDFCEKIKTIDIKPIEFHMARGDFEVWVHSLGDAELAKRLRLIREAGLTGEKLRNRLYKALKSRCEELLKK